MLPIITYILLYLVYSVGFFFASLAFRVSETHYFLGFGKPLFSFTIRKINFSVGIYIPIVFLGRIYSFVDGKKQPARFPWEFNQHSLLKRLLVTVSGALSMFFFGILVFIGLNYFETESIITKETVNKYGIFPSDKASESGLQRGDKILAVNGKDFEEFHELINPEIVASPGSYYTVLRNGQTFDVKITSPLSLEHHKELYITLLVPFEVGQVLEGSPAEQAGILKGDRIKTVNGHPIVKHIEMNREFARDEDGTADLEIERTENGTLKTRSMQIILTPEKKAGFYIQELIPYTLKQNSILEATQKGLSRSLRSIRTNINGFASVVGGSVPKNRTVSGPIGIVPVNNSIFWPLAGQFAMWFAFWNFLPLPKSSFWEMIALAYERITRKKYSKNTFNKSLYIGWCLVALFFVLILFGDVLRLIRY